MIGWENDRGAYFINKLQDEIEAVSDKADDVASDIGKLSDLTTTAKTSIVAAINEVNSGSGGGEIGNLSDLRTSDKTNIVAAINEVDTNADTANNHIGTMTNLTTRAKDTLVKAINEVKADAKEALESMMIVRDLENNTQTSVMLDTDGTYIVTANGTAGSDYCGVWFVGTDFENNITIVPMCTIGQYASLTGTQSDLIMKNLKASGDESLINYCIISIRGFWEEN